MYEWYKKWKKQVKMLMDSVLEEESGKAKCKYLKFWFGEEGLPLIQKWEDTQKIKYTGAYPSRYKLQMYWTWPQVPDWTKTEAEMLKLAQFP